MTILQAIVYGIIQGAGEFLPISSSAHLIMAPRLFGWEDPGLAFDVALHMGTLLAVILFFGRDWLVLLQAGLRSPASNKGKLFWYLVIATIPGAVVGKLFEKQAEEAFRNPLLIGIMMIIMGILLYVADQRINISRLEQIGFRRSLLIGVSQALAIIPGVSRSGVTMTSALFLGLTREDAARFSFLLSTPIILGAGLLKMKDLLHTPIDTVPFAVGIITSAVVGLISIKFLLDYLRNKGFGIFVVYRFVAGAVFIASYFLK